MTELDKKTFKSQTDLVQSVLEAQEKRNFERVDMLVTNAIKQLKMSRFKPDHTTCISLTYLARVCPRVFMQSNAIKEVLRALLRRDNGIASIKGKNDFVLPVLAANILLACCDGDDVRTIILNKIDQWLGSNQKTNDLIQHLLATICTKCQGDPPTIAILLESRHHWLPYMNDNYDQYDSVPSDLCSRIRKLLHSETNCEYLLAYLKFLLRHDTDISGLSEDISRFVVERPISLNSMLKEDEFGPQLNNMILKIYTKLFSYLKTTKHVDDDEPMPDVNETNKAQSSKHGIGTIKTDSKAGSTGDVKKLTVKLEDETKPKSQIPAPPVKVKIEPGLEQDEKKPIQSQSTILLNATQKEQSIKSEMKMDTESHQPTKINPSKSEENFKQSTHSNGTNGNSGVPVEEDTAEIPVRNNLFIRLPNCPHIIELNQQTIEATLTLLALVDNEECLDEFNALLESLLSDTALNQADLLTIYEDKSLMKIYNLPDRLRQKLIHSSNDHLNQLALRNATPAQLVMLLHQFGLPIATVDKILNQFNSIDNLASVCIEIKDTSYFQLLIEFYSGEGAHKAKEFGKRLEQSFESKKTFCVS